LSLFSKLVVAATGARPVEKLVTETRPGKALAHRFVAGDSLDEAVEAAKQLNSSGLLVSLDLLGEEVHDATSAERAMREYLDSLDRIEAEDLNANISIKLTQLGLSIDEDLALESVGTLARRAAQIGTTVTIDMEDSRYTESTVRIYMAAQADKGNIGIALQSYMRRTRKDLEEVMRLGGHIRLCKGAYVEPEELAYQTRSEIAESFAISMRDLMTNEAVRPAVATHDLSLIDLARELGNERKGYFEFQMLYGVRTALQAELIEAGFPLRIYLPFGSQWYPYLTRRLAERPANAWFFVRALLGS